MNIVKMSKMSAKEFISELHKNSSGEVKLACWYWLHAQPPSKEHLEALDALNEFNN